jgi:hypothetical protein
MAGAKHLAQLDNGCVAVVFRVLRQVVLLFCGEHAVEFMSVYVVFFSP